VFFKPPGTANEGAGLLRTWPRSPRGRGDFPAARDHVERSHRAQRLQPTGAEPPAGHPRHAAPSQVRTFSRGTRRRSDGRDHARGACADWRQRPQRPRSRPCCATTRAPGSRRRLDLHQTPASTAMPPALLDRLAAVMTDKARVDPLVHYLPRLRRRPCGRDDAGSPRAAKAAQSVSLDHAFPFQAEAIRGPRAGDGGRRAGRPRAVPPRQPALRRATWASRHTVGAAVQLQPDFTVALRNPRAGVRSPGDEGRVRPRSGRARACHRHGRPAHPFTTSNSTSCTNPRARPVAKRLAMMESHRSAILARDDSTASYIGLLTITDAPTPPLRGWAAASSTSGRAERASTPATPGPTPTSRARSPAPAARRNRQALADFRSRWFSGEPPRRATRGHRRTHGGGRPTGPGVAQNALGANRRPATPGGPRPVRTSRSHGAAATTPPSNAPFSSTTRRRRSAAR